MKTVINLVLAVCVVALIYICYGSIMGPINFDKERAIREKAIITRLIDIRKAQQEYRTLHHGAYTDNFDSLIAFVKTAKLPFIMKVGTLTDDQLNSGMTEQKAMDLINNPYFDLEAYAEVAGFEITGFGGYQAMIMGTDEIKTNNLHVGAKVAYTIEPVGKLSASTTFLSMIPTAKGAEAQNAMSLELALENTTLVTGATLKAGYKTWNIIDNDFGPYQDMGEVYVSATIEF